MAIGLISVGGLCKEEVIAKSAGLDILAHSTVRSGRRRSEREKGKIWNEKRSIQGDRGKDLTGGGKKVQM